MGIRFGISPDTEIRLTVKDLVMLAPLLGALIGAAWWARGFVETVNYTHSYAVGLGEQVDKLDERLHAIEDAAAFKH